MVSSLITSSQVYYCTYYQWAVSFRTGASASHLFCMCWIWKQNILQSCLVQNWKNWSVEQKILDFDNTAPSGDFPPLFLWRLALVCNTQYCGYQLSGSAGLCGSELFTSLETGDGSMCRGPISSQKSGPALAWMVNFLLDEEVFTTTKFWASPKKMYFPGSSLFKIPSSLTSPGLSASKPVNFLLCSQSQSCISFH